MSHLEDIEEDVTDAVAGVWAARVESFRRAVVALWSAKGEALSREEVLALLSRLQLPTETDTFATDLLLPAAVEGDARIVGDTAVHLSPVAVKALGDVADKPAFALAGAETRARVVPLATLAGVLAVVGPLSRSVADMEAGVSWAVHTAANEATVSAAAQRGKELVFVAERDACLQCIGLSGSTGPTITHPPIHPRCRCELQPFDDPAVPRALQREAIRSVLRGFSLPSESEAARIRAAREMLARRPNAPQSVLDYARRAVDKGRFPRGRRTP